MKKDLMLLYGIFAYLIFILTIAYCIAFFGNLFVADKAFQLCSCIEGEVPIVLKIERDLEYPQGAVLVALCQ